MTRTLIQIVSNEPYYDLNDDWSLIVSSFLSQYGIRLATDLATMKWREFAYLLEGLSGDSPLGRIISVRAENDPDVIKNFDPQQRQIRNEYRRKIALKKTDAEVERAMDGFKQAFIAMASNEKT